MYNVISLRDARNLMISAEFIYNWRCIHTVTQMRSDLVRRALWPKLGILQCPFCGLRCDAFSLV